MAGRKRYVAVGNKWVEVDPDYVQPPADHQNLLWNDRAYQDMNDPRFKSRSEHREYMRQNGLTTMDDFKGEWQKSAQQRAEFYQGRDPSRKHDVARAVEMITQGKRRA